MYPFVPGRVLSSYVRVNGSNSSGDSNGSDDRSSGSNNSSKQKEKRTKEEASQLVELTGSPRTPLTRGNGLPGVPDKEMGYWV